jgi:two-component system, cell cycle sensor histidine kinase DivJ
VTMFLRIWDLAKGMAHDSASDALDRERHALFIASKLVLAVAALSCAPLYFALVGAPSGVDAFALVFALTPLACVLAASRTGDLVGAAALGVAGLIGFVVAVSISAPGMAGVVGALLVAAPLEALIAGSIPLVSAAVAASLAAAFACAFIGAGQPSAQMPATLLLALGLLYSGAVCAGLVRLQKMRRNSGLNARANFEGLSAVLQDMILHMDRSGAVQGGVQQNVSLLGLGARDFAGRGLFERVHVGDRPLFLKTISDAAASDRPIEADVRVRGAVAEDDAVWFGYVRLRVGRVNVPGEARLVAVLRDVREEKTHAEDLAAAREMAEQSSASKDRFLANISHELRTPLNAIIGFSEILGSDVMPLDVARRCEYANIINSSGQHLLSVVNSILDISKIEAGSFQITPDHFELEPLIAQCFDIVRLKAEENGVVLRRETLSDIPEVVADKRAVKQVLINLVSNAVKFTGKGGSVTIRSRLVGASVSVEIEDSGIGVLARDLSRLGDPFFQAKDSYDRPYEGTGLGLSVVRGLVGLHGGAMKIESAPGEGTRVTFTLPLDCRALPDQQRARSARIETIPNGPFRVISTEDKVKQIA